MKTLFFFALLSLASTSFAESANCKVNNKFKGVGTISVELSKDGSYQDVRLHVRLIDGHDSWKGRVARQELSGDYESVKIKAQHRFSNTMSQKFGGNRLETEFFLPGIRRVESKMALNEQLEIKSITVNETIYNDFQRVEGRNSISCAF